MYQEMLTKYNISNYALAKKTGIPYTTLSELYTGKRTIGRCHISVLEKLSNGLQVPMDEIYQIISAEKYITGIHALNLSDDTQNPCDWHSAGLKWENIDIRNIPGSVLGMQGITYNEKTTSRFNVRYLASPERACADLLLCKHQCETIYQYLDNKESVLKMFSMIASCKNRIAEADYEYITQNLSKQYEMLWVNFKNAYAKKKGIVL